MGSETIIVRWCDVCAAEKPDAPKVEAEQVSVHTGGFKVDLCKKHRAPFDQVTELIKEYGYRESASGIQPARAKQGQPGRKSSTKITDPLAKVCPECLNPFSGTNGLSTLRNHMRNVHGTSRTAYTADELQAASDDARRQALALDQAQAPLVKAG